MSDGAGNRLGAGHRADARAGAARPHGAAAGATQQACAGAASRARPTIPPPPLTPPAATRSASGAATPPAASSAALDVRPPPPTLRSLVIGLAALVGCGIVLMVVIHAVGPDRLRSAVAATGPLAPIAYILLKAATVVVTPLSGTPLRLAAGTLFGYWDGVLYSVLAGVLGGSINFWIGRLFGRTVVARLLGPAALARVEPLLGRLSNWRALALARLALAPLWDVLSYGVGLTRLRFRTYVLVAAIGDLLPTMLLVAAGSALLETGSLGIGLLDEALTGAVAQPVAPVSPWAAVPAIVLALALAGAAILSRSRVTRLLAAPERRPGLAPRPEEKAGPASADAQVSRIPPPDADLPDDGTAPGKASGKAGRAA